MKVMLIRPRPARETIGLQHVMIVEPLELEILGTLIQEEYTPVIVDMILEKKNLEYFLAKEEPDILCITGYITNIPKMLDYCRRTKKHNPRIATVAGGVHCEVCPGDFDDKAVDYRVVRNAARNFKSLIDHIAGKAPLPAGILKCGENTEPQALPPYDFHVPIPDRSLTQKYRKKYFYIFHDKVALMKTSFGCPYPCNFCFCRQITGTQYVERDMGEVLDELEGIEEKEIYIVDDDFLCRRERVMDFIKGCRERGIQKSYLLYGRADFIAKNPDVVEEFKSIGLRTVIVGLESFNTAELEQYAKGTSVEMNEKGIQILKKNRVDCFATLILSPSWEQKDFDALGKKAIELGIHYVNLQPLTPLPGTGFEVDREKLLIPYGQWEKWDLAHLMIRPEKMSVPDYYLSIIKLYAKILFRPRILLNYIKNYSPRMLWKMFYGSYMVRKQYIQKMKEARSNA